VVVVVGPVLPLLVLLLLVVAAVAMGLMQWICLRLLAPRTSLCPAGCWAAGQTLGRVWLAAWAPMGEEDQEPGVRGVWSMVQGAGSRRVTAQEKGTAQGTGQGLRGTVQGLRSQGEVYRVVGVAAGMTGMQRAATRVVGQQQWGRVAAVVGCMVVSRGSMGGLQLAATVASLAVTRTLASLAATAASLSAMAASLEGIMASLAATATSLAATANSLAVMVASLASMAASLAATALTTPAASMLGATVTAQARPLWLHLLPAFLLLLLRLLLLHHQLQQRSQVPLQGMASPCLSQCGLCHPLPPWAPLPPTAVCSTSGWAGSPPHTWADLDHEGPEVVQG